MISKDENILLHAEKLFAEKGFSGTSTREISKEANINISMISYYFGSKEKLFERIFEYRMNQGIGFAVGIVEKNNLNAWEKFILIIENYIERVKTLKSFYLILQREQLSRHTPHIIEFLKESKKVFLDVYRKIIEQGIQENIFTKNPRLEHLHSTISGTMFTSMNALCLYKEFMNGDENYEDQYYEDLDKHLKNILKYLLGYEED